MPRHEGSGSGQPGAGVGEAGVRRAGGGGADQCSAASHLPLPWFEWSIDAPYRG